MGFVSVEEDAILTLTHSYRNLTTDTTILSTSPSALKSTIISMKSEQAFKEKFNLMTKYYIEERKSETLRDKAAKANKMNNDRNISVYTQSYIR